VFSGDDLEDFFKQILNQLNPAMNNSTAEKNAKPCKDKGKPGVPPDDLEKDFKNRCLSVNPSNLIVIASLLTGALTVDSLLVDKQQTVQVVLTGTLRRKTQLDKMVEQIVKLPAEQVIEAILNAMGIVT
jgi:hypothetical protein